MHGETHCFEDPTLGAKPSMPVEFGHTSSEAEDVELNELNEWIDAKQLPKGSISFDFADPQSGEQKAVFDLAWPDGVQEGLSEPVAVLLNERAETIAVANEAGFRCFTTQDAFKRYVEREILAEVEETH